MNEYIEIICLPKHILILNVIGNIFEIVSSKKKKYILELL